MRSKLGTEAHGPDAVLFGNKLLKSHKLFYFWPKPVKWEKKNVWEFFSLPSDNFGKAAYME